MFAQDVTTDQLTILVEVVDAGSFSAAARRLRRTQGSVSYHVARLEEQLELQLFDRSGHRPVLTPEGVAVLGAARRVIEDLRHLRHTALRISEGLETRVVINVDVIYPPERLAEVLRAFRDAFPTVDLVLHSGILDEPVRALARGEADLALAPDWVDPALVARPSAVVQLVAVAAAGHPLAAEVGPIPAAELDRHVRLVLPTEQRHPRLLDSSRLQWRIRDLYARHQLVRAGLGWARLPRHQVAEDLRVGRLVVLEGEAWPGGGTEVVLSVLRDPDRVLGPAGRWLEGRLGGAG